MRCSMLLRTSIHLIVVSLLISRLTLAEPPPVNEEQLQEHNLQATIAALKKNIAREQEHRVAVETRVRHLWDKVKDHWVFPAT